MDNAVKSSFTELQSTDCVSLLSLTRLYEWVPLQVEKQEFGLKPMNCPGHCLIFDHRVRSYRGEFNFIVSYICLIASVYLCTSSVKANILFQVISLSDVFPPPPKFSFLCMFDKNYNLLVICSSQKSKINFNNTFTATTLSLFMHFVVSITPLHYNPIIVSSKQELYI